MSSSDALDLVEGFMEGAIAAEGLDALISCVQDIETVIPTAEKTYSDCRDSGLSSKFDCVKDFASIAKDTVSTIKDCKNVGDDITKLS
jgi:hypothetical protein